MKLPKARSVKEDRKESVYKRKKERKKESDASFREGEESKLIEEAIHQSGRCVNRRPDNTGTEHLLTHLCRSGPGRRAAHRPAQGNCSHQLLQLRAKTDPPPTHPRPTPFCNYFLIRLYLARDVFRTLIFPDT